MPKVSIITTAKDEKEFVPLKKALEKQTFKDFELVTTTKGTIPEAWNKCIKKAKGEIIIFTETDARPLNERWLEDLVKGLEKHNKGDPEKKTIIKGIEISPQIWNLCTLGMYKKAFDKYRFNENFPRVEDTELFTRLRKDGYKGVMVPGAFMLHRPRKQFKRYIKNEFTGGYLEAKVFLKHGQVGFNSPSLNESNKSSKVLKRELTTIISRIAFLFGLLLGAITYYLGDKREQK